MIFGLVTFGLVTFGPVTDGQTDGQTDRQTESDAYEPTVHKHRWAKKVGVIPKERMHQLEL